jgi:excisionase family DNA binding protein
MLHLVAGEVRYYTLEDAARILRLSPERVREMLEDGELEGTRTGDAGGWRVPLRGVPEMAPPSVEVPLKETAPEPALEEPEDTEVPLPEPDPPRAETRELPEKPGEPGAHPASFEEARQPLETSGGESAATSREPTSESGWVSTQQAARALRISARTVRWHIERGNLEAKPEGEGVERMWRVSIDSLNTFRDARQRQGQSPRDYHASTPSAETTAAYPGSAIRELADRLVEEARRAEAARVRLELAERAQSSLQAELIEERGRREAAEKEREEAQKERDELLRSLKASKQAEEPRERSESMPPTREGAPRAPETPAQGFGTDAAGGGPQRQASPRWWRRWRRS